MWKLNPGFGARPHQCPVQGVVTALVLLATLWITQTRTSGKAQTICNIPWCWEALVQLLQGGFSGPASEGLIYSRGSPQKPLRSWMETLHSAHIEKVDVAWEKPFLSRGNLMGFILWSERTSWLLTENITKCSWCVHKPWESTSSPLLLLAAPCTSSILWGCSSQHSCTEQNVYSGEAQRDSGALTRLCSRVCSAASYHNIPAEVGGILLMCSVGLDSSSEHQLPSATEPWARAYSWHIKGAAPSAPMFSGKGDGRI